MSRNKRKKNDSRTLPGKEAAAPAAAEPAPGSPGAPAKRHLTTYDWIRENLEAITVAFILALVIRHFSVEAFEIPTGSMAPTLYGIHAWTQCPNCDTRFNIGLQSDNATGKLQVDYEAMLVYRGSCPQCEMRLERGWPVDSPPAAGEKVRCTARISKAAQQPRECRGEVEVDPEALKEEQVIVRSGGSSARRSGPGIRCPICEFDYHPILAKSRWTRGWSPGAMLGKLRYYLGLTSDISGGHKILVNKFTYRVGAPERFDVIVFQMDEEKNYIKRLLALPGETVRILGGDLYVKGPGDAEFRIVRKERPKVREVLWFLISDTTVAERGFNPNPAWKEVYETRSGIDPETPSKWWTWLDDVQRWTVNAAEPAGRIAALKYNRACINYYNYNALTPAIERSRKEEVGDKKAAFTVRPARGGGKDPGWIGGEIRDGEFTYQFRIPVGAPSADRPAVLFRLAAGDPWSPDPGREPPAELAAERAEAPAALPPLEESRIEFENADDRVAVRLDGKEILALEYSSGSPVLNPDEHYLVLLASGVSADFESIQVHRDVYYTHPVGSSQRPVLPDPSSTLAVRSIETGGENEYFPGGDNSPSSYDGRFWGTVPERNLMGKAFVIFWPIWRTKWQAGFIR